MPDQNPPRRPMLYKGEEYVRPIERSGGGGNAKDLPFTFEEAKEKISTGIQSIKSKMREVPQDKRLPNEYVVSIRMSPGFSAKSYYPASLFEEDENQRQFAEVGSRNWVEPSAEDESENKRGKMFFVRTNDDGLDWLESKLSRSQDKLTQAFQADVRKISNIDTLSPEEQMMGIPDDWEEGHLELVVHPFNMDRDVVVTHFQSLLANAGIDEQDIRIKQYDGGITFASVKGDRNLIETLKGYNPLRIAHPLTFRKFPSLRGNMTSNCPQAPVDTNRSSIIVGMFDGGTTGSNPILLPFCECIEATTEPEDEGDVDHGTAVAGALLWGPLNEFRSTDHLPSPAVSIRSFRVLPTSDSGDVDLYEVIDAIENIVPRHNDIKVYNISMGPEGPIYDDHISRFTFALDLLSYKHNVLFCTAVGNWGDRGNTLSRIQPPSDSVNNISVAATTEVGGVIERPDYSSIGPGREGNKLKPDVAAFGGCERNPFHLISVEPGNRCFSSGTSFACPIAANKVGQLIGRSNNVLEALTARAVVTHRTAIENGSQHSFELGHGQISDDLEFIITSTPNSYTLIYQGILEPKKYVEIEIPWVPIPSGKAQFEWTSVVMCPVNPHAPDDYTMCSLATTFYANANKYKFTRKNGNKIETKTIDIQEEAQTVKDLLSEGWEQNAFPVSDNGPTPFAKEEELRSDFKWDTIDHRKTGKVHSNIKDPMFHIHAYSRGSHTIDHLKYALVLTVTAPQSIQDFYSKIRANYPVLQPVEIQTEVEVQVRNENAS